jgi:preprotein translocase subunit SecD
VAPPRRGGGHPGRILAVLTVLIVVMLVGILGKQTFTPAKWQSQFKVGLGLDLSSGTQVVLQAQLPKGQTPSTGDMQEAISVIQSRVDGTGNSNATVQQQGANLIDVSVPGKGSQSTVNLISSTAELRFRPVLLYEPYTAATTTPSAKASGTPTPTPSASPSVTPSPSASSTAKAKTSALIVGDSSTPSPSTSAKATSTASPKASASASPSPSATSSASAASSAFGAPTQVNAATTKLFDKLKCTPSKSSTTVDDSWKSTVGYGEDENSWDKTGSQIVSCDSSGNKYVLGPATFTGEAVTAVSPQLESNSTGWVVSITLNSTAASAWQKLTENQYDNYYPSINTSENDAILDQTAVALDGDVVSAAQTDAVLSSSFQIQGSSSSPFTEEYASYLSNVIKFGQLPLSFTIQDVSSTSPTLGHDSLVAGLLAGVIGLFLVVIYLFAYYRGLGIVSVSSLLIAGMLAYFGVVLLSLYDGFTMTLAGIAGLVVAIGITADSFIVFFERLRDEVRDGKSLRPAVESGWKRARRTVLVSDTVSFLAAILLYYFSTSEVQGFAFTLGMTTLIDVLVVFTFTKPMVTILAGTKFFGGGHPWSGLDPKRLGARAPWRGTGRRTVRTQRTSSTGRTGSSSATGSSSSTDSSTTSREA